MDAPMVNEDFTTGLHITFYALETIFTLAKLAEKFT